MYPTTYKYNKYILNYIQKKPLNCGYLETTYKRIIRFPRSPGLHSHRQNSVRGKFSKIEALSSWVVNRYAFPFYIKQLISLALAKVTFFLYLW